jgi:hypothetical protein
MQSKQAYVTITDAFKRVTIWRPYRNEWITAGDWVRIIIHAHDLSPATLDATTLRKALQSTFPGAEDATGHSGLFRKSYTPRGCSRVYCYFFVQTEGVCPPLDIPLPWFEYISNIDVLQEEASHTITEEQKRELIAALRSLSVATPKPGTKKDSAARGWQEAWSMPSFMKR